MSTTRTQRIDAPSTLVRVRSKRHPSCPTGTVVAWSKTNGVTPGKSPRMREISTPPDPSASSGREGPKRKENMIDRRDFLRIASLTAVWPYAPTWAQPSGLIVNDVHSQLNATRVHRIVEPETLD